MKWKFEKKGFFPRRIWVVLGGDVEISAIFRENRGSPGATNLPRVGTWALESTSGVLVSWFQAIAELEHVAGLVQRDLKMLQKILEISGIWVVLGSDVETSAIFHENRGSPGATNLPWVGTWVLVRSQWHQLKSSGTRENVLKHSRQRIRNQAKMVQMGSFPGFEATFSI